MSDEIYNHMPRWRRLIRDLAREAGVKNFLNHSSDDSNKSTEPRNSLTVEEESDETESER